MSEIMKIIAQIKGECECGAFHDTSIRDIRIGSSLVKHVGEILKENSFPKKLLLVADKNTLNASKGIEASLTDFEVEYKVYDNLRVATMNEVNEIISLISGKDIAVISVGTGSLNDPCRVACALENKLFCIFATAPSMDGFASYSSPIVVDGFKVSLPAKSPEVIIADTKILAEAPAELKSAGFGDMIAKYVALIDWRVSSLLTNEPYCEKVASLTRKAVDELMELCDKVTVNDEKTAGKIFEALIKTGVGMSFMQNSRPASGAEHIISHLMECVELRDGIIPNYHGNDVGVCTLYMLKLYSSLCDMEEISPKKEEPDWNDIFHYYGSMKDDVVKMNFPENIVDDVDINKLKNSWSQIKSIIKDVPSYEECYEAMKKAGCALSIGDISKSEKLFYDCVKYSPYMRRRLTLLRMRDIIGF